jgi:hypothetical protein
MDRLIYILAQMHQFMDFFEEAIMFKRIAVSSLIWLFVPPALAAGLILSSPHGGAAFLWCAIILGIVGAIAQAALFLRARLTGGELAAASIIRNGFFCGAASFPISTLVLEKSLQVPHDVFQVLLFVFLLAVGTAIGWLIAKLQPPVPN